MSIQCFYLYCHCRLASINYREATLESPVVKRLSDKQLSYCGRLLLDIVKQDQQGGDIVVAALSSVCGRCYRMRLEKTETITEYERTNQQVSYCPVITASLSLRHA